MTLWWIEAYGGGLFLPVRDGTCGRETYGGGRYLTDTVKGTYGRGLTVLAGRPGAARLQLPLQPLLRVRRRVACPLAPPENRVDVPIRAGELSYPRRDG